MKRWLFLLVICGLFACEDEGEFDPCKSDFDQQALLENVLKLEIQPAFSRLHEHTQALLQAKKKFTENPNTSGLLPFRTAFLNTYLNYQNVDLYSFFGPAESEQLQSLLNNFPVDVTAIEANISNGRWDLTKPDAYDRGLPALDYLLYGTGDNEDAIVQYFQDNNAALQYLSHVVNDIAAVTMAVNTAWQGDYAQTFASNTGTAAGTGVSQLVNALNQHYENIKRDKVGIPSGVTTLGFTNPTRVEAYYSGFSLELAKAALQANYDLFKGSTGQGFDDYLTEVNTNRKDDPVDVAAIEQQYKAALDALNAIRAERLSGAVEEDNEAVINLYNELVKQIVRIKRDMPDALCVPITYIDNPSDSD